MSNPATYVKPWAHATEPMWRDLWAQYAGMYTDDEGKKHPAYSYFLNGDATTVTGLLGANGGLVDPVTGLDRGIGPPRSGVVPPMPPEPQFPRATDHVEPGFDFNAEERGQQPEPR